MDAKVFLVEKVCFHIEKINPPQLVVQAVGQVNSSGWTNGRLTPYVYVSPPDDGIQDFDFIATAPDGIVLWVMSPITGIGVIPLPPWAKGVRVHGSSNDVEVMLDDPDCTVDGQTLPSGDVWPWPWATAFAERS